MFESFKQVQAYFKKRESLGIKPGLDRVNRLLKMTGDPQEQIQAVHIAGTNGKGSTISFLKNALQANGYQVGVFSSPSLEGLLGHIFINDSTITEEAFILLINEIHPFIQQLDNDLMHPTEFEIITVIALVYFKNHVDIALIEAGMGGRYDTTNCFDPILSIITNVERDHTTFLGDTIKEIAYHKAGIVKYQKPIITGEISESGWSVIKDEAEGKQSKIYTLGHEFTYEVVNADEQKYLFNWKYNEKPNSLVTIQMHGIHQVKNASLALMALVLLSEEDYVINLQKSLEGIKNTLVQGRFEIIRASPTIILDGAHNPAGITAFLQAVTARYAQHEKHLIFAAFIDKELEVMLDQLKDQFASITVTTFDHPRAAKAKDLYSVLHTKDKYIEEDWKNAINKINEGEHPLETCYFITGSLNFISMVRAYFVGLHL